MSVLTVRPGDLVTFDPSDIRVLEFDWDDENLAVAATIVTSVFIIKPLRGYVVSLTKDNESVLTGDRKTQVRVNATTARVGQQYRLSNKILTSETPAQTKEQSIEILVQNR